MSLELIREPPIIIFLFIYSFDKYLRSISCVLNIHIRVVALILDSAERTFPSLQKVILDTAILRTTL